MADDRLRVKGTDAKQAEIQSFLLLLANSRVQVRSQCCSAQTVSKYLLSMNQLMDAWMNELKNRSD
jgi:hypothetical protein